MRLLHLKIVKMSLQPVYISTSINVLLSHVIILTDSDNVLKRTYRRISSIQGFQMKIAFLVSHISKFTSTFNKYKFPTSYIAICTHTHEYKTLIWSQTLNSLNLDQTYMRSGFKRTSLKIEWLGTHSLPYAQSHTGEDFYLKSFPSTITASLLHTLFIDSDTDAIGYSRVC